MREVVTKVKAEIIAVGTEILMGQIVNTNATFLSEELANLGFDVYYQSVVGDNFSRLEEVLEIADSRSELIILCGGLGPTEDDITKEALAKHVNEQLIVDDDALTIIENYINRPDYTMTTNNHRQAQYVSGSTKIMNPKGLAIGCLYQADKRHYIVLPGPPNELHAMFRKNVVPLLKEILPQTSSFYTRVLRFFGIGESQLVTDIADIIESQTNPTVAPYAKMNEVTLRLTAKSDNEDEGKQMVDVLAEQILSRVGQFYYGDGDETTLQQAVVELLKENNRTISSAESITCGLFQSSLGEISGVSSVFPGGFVTYSEEAKVQLGVKKETIKEFGVISKECAKEMADSVKHKLLTDYAVSFTGIAGPDSMENQQVGTVWIGLASPNQPTYATKYEFKRDRNAIRNRAVMTGLDMVRRQILKDN